jgi:hypothetical protein
MKEQDNHYGLFGRQQVGVLQWLLMTSQVGLF